MKKPTKTEPETENFIIDIDISAMRKPFNTQFTEMGLEVDLKHYEKPADAIICLSVYGYISQETAEKARRKLVEEIVEDVEEQHGKITSVGKPKKVRRSIG